MSLEFFLYRCLLYLAFLFKLCCFSSSILIINQRKYIQLFSKFLYQNKPLNCLICIQVCAHIYMSNAKRFSNGKLIGTKSYKNFRLRHFTIRVGKKTLQLNCLSYAMGIAIKHTGWHGESEREATIFTVANFLSFSRKFPIM